MPIEGSGWELLVRRVDEHERNGKQRTVGTYQVFWDGSPRSVRGMCAETRGPGSNAAWELSNSEFVKTLKRRERWLRQRDGKYCDQYGVERLTDADLDPGAAR